MSTKKREQTFLGMSGVTDFCLANTAVSEKHRYQPAPQTKIFKLVMPEPTWWDFTALLVKGFIIIFYEVI